MSYYVCPACGATHMMGVEIIKNTAKTGNKRVTITCPQCRKEFEIDIEMENGPRKANSN